MGRVNNPERTDDTQIPVAALLDLAATKVKVVQDRASLKDYLDIDRILLAGVTLAQALGAAKAVYGRQFNAALSLRALAYFNEGDVKAIDAAAKRRLEEAVKTVDLAALPVYKAQPGILCEDCA